ncbi:hypothetical protein DERF_007832 [Dermatophagoides farinae]|uniref:Uncharacterized protein n=1 Tax=Dermatophagoides farinae TaxID=6954 RepID=A0A922L418_DERFA|nr:hypothetical protein DERF_007832 [Dermatophagoides farinae]
MPMLPMIFVHQTIVAYLSFRHLIHCFNDRLLYFISASAGNVPNSRILRIHSSIFLPNIEFFDIFGIFINSIYGISSFCRRAIASILSSSVRICSLTASIRFDITDNS